MEKVQLGIHHLPLTMLREPRLLEEHIYPNMYKNYYWSEDFSAQYYIAQAKAGFIAVTDLYEAQEFLLPEIQFSYALLDFEDLHISKKVKKLMAKKEFQIDIGKELDAVAEKINAAHRNCWLSKRYLEMLKETENIDENFKIITITLKEDQEIIAGEIGYIIGRTYTSLSGFSSREKRYRNYGTVQLVLLAEYLKANGFAFWNLGQPYMTYKLALGAKIYERQTFLKRWFQAIH